MEKGYHQSLFDEKRKTGDYYYAYEVETMTDNSAIYLLRPTWKRGMDYLVVYKSKDGSIHGPKFEDVDADLAAKKKAEPKLFESLLESAAEVHRGNDPMETLAHFPAISGCSWVGMPVENVLKTMKWLFIDEDIKFWGHEGRDKWKWKESSRRSADESITRLSSS